MPRGRGRPTKQNAAKLRLLMELRAAGKSYAHCAKQIGVGATTCAAWERRNK